MASYLKTLIRANPAVHKVARAVRRAIRPDAPPPPDYDHDCLTVYGKSTDFLRDERFQAAYRAGIATGHKYDDLHIEWRVHMTTWAASHGAHLEGDFVECGVNTGISSVAICHYVDFNATGKSFYLFDTFRGLPEEQIPAAERGSARIGQFQKYYEECYETARRNFAPFPRAVLVRGTIPETLATVDIPKVCYLAIDMNLVIPEMAAIEHFWPRLVPGAMVVLDDYGWTNHADQKAAMDAFAAGQGVRIATLPTGQGLLVKP